MEYIKIPLKGKHGAGKFVLVDGDYDGEYFSQFTWYLNPAGYAVRDGRCEGSKSYIYLHKEVIGVIPKGMMADHIDRDKLNNRSCNLRAVTPSGNSRNRPQSAGVKSLSGYRGVTSRKTCKGFDARIRGKHLGRFISAVAAAKAYDEAAIVEFGKDAILNFS